MRRHVYTHCYTATGCNLFASASTSQPISVCRRGQPSFQFKPCQLAMRAANRLTQPGNMLKMRLQLLSGVGECLRHLLHIHAHDRSLDKVLGLVPGWKSMHQCNHRASDLEGQKGFSIATSSSPCCRRVETMVDCAQECSPWQVSNSSGPRASFPWDVTRPQQHNHFHQ